MLGQHERREKHGRKGHAADGGHFLGEKIEHGRGQQHQEDQDQADGHFDSADADVQRHLELPRIAVLETQHDHRRRLEHKTPHHAKGIRLAQHVNVAAAGNDGEQLQADDQVEQPMGRAVAAVGLQEPLGHHAVLGHAVQHAVAADHRRIDRAGQNQKSHHDDEGVEKQPGQRRPDHVHRQSADQVVRIDLHADFVGNQPPGHKGDAGRQQQAIDEDNKRRLLEIGQFWRLDLPVHLRQRLFAAHGQDRMAEGDQHAR